VATCSRNILQANACNMGFLGLPLHDKSLESSGSVCCLKQRGTPLSVAHAQDSCQCNHIEKRRNVLTWNSSCKRVPSTALSLLLPPKRSSSTAWRLHLKLPLTLVPDSSRSGCRITMPATCSHLLKQQVQHNTHKQGQIGKFGYTALSKCAKPAEVRVH